MSRKLEISRRDFMAGAFRGRNAPLAPTEEIRISRDFEAPTNAPDVPEWGEQGLREVLESMNDLSGIEEP